MYDEDAEDFSAPGDFDGVDELVETVEVAWRGEILRVLVVHRA